MSKHHFPEGPWLQPDGLYVGRCRCGESYQGRDGGEAELAWLNHFLATRQSDSRPDVERVASQEELIERVARAISDKNWQPDCSEEFLLARFHDECLHPLYIKQAQAAIAAMYTLRVE